MESDKLGRASSVKGDRGNRELPTRPDKNKQTRQDFLLEQYHNDGNKERAFRKAPPTDQRPMSEPANMAASSRSNVATPPRTAIPVLRKRNAKKSLLPPSLLPQSPQKFIKKRFSHLSEDQMPLSRRAKTKLAQEDQPVEVEQQQPMPEEKPKKKKKKKKETNGLIVKTTENQESLLRPRSEKPVGFDKNAPVSKPPPPKVRSGPTSPRKVILEDAKEAWAISLPEASRLPVTIPGGPLDTSILFTPEPETPISPTPPASPVVENSISVLDDPNLFVADESDGDADHSSNTDNPPKRATKKTKAKKRRKFEFSTDELLSKMIAQKIGHEEYQSRALRRHRNNTFDTAHSSKDQELATFIERNAYQWKLSRTNATSATTHSFNDWKKHLVYARKMEESGDCAAAMPHIIIACCMCPQHPQPILRRAEVLAKLGLWKQVIIDTSRAIKLHQEHKYLGNTEDDHEKVNLLEKSAQYLRARAFCELESPDLSSALRDLDHILNEKKELPVFIRIRARLEKARVKRLYALEGDKSAEERTRILDWALQDLDMVEEEHAAESDTPLSPGAAKIPELHDIFIARAEVVLELYKISQDFTRLQEYEKMLKNAFETGLLDVYVIRKASNVFIDHNCLEMGLMTLSSIRSFIQTKRSNKLVATPLPRTSRATIATSAATKPSRRSFGTASPSSSRKVRTFTQRSTPADCASVANEFETFRQEARLHAVGKHYQKAAQSCIEALKIFPKDYMTLCYLAEIHCCNDQHNKALECLSAIPAENPTATAHMRRVRFNVLLHVGKHAGALQDLEKLTSSSSFKEFSHEEQSYCWIRLAQLQMGCFSNAESALKVTEHLRAEPSSLLVRGLANLRQNNFATAVSCFSKLIYVNPKDANLYLLRGWANSQLECKMECVMRDLIHYNLLCEGQPEGVRSLRKAKLLLIPSKIWDPAQAFKIFVNCHREEPKAETLSLIVESVRQISRKLGKVLQDYIPVLEQVIAETLEGKNKSNRLLLFEIAKCYHAIGKFDTALVYYNKSFDKSTAKEVKKNPGALHKSEMSLARGTCRTQQLLQSKKGVMSPATLDSFLGATKDLQCCGEGNVDALLQRAEVYASCGEFRVAASLCSRAIAAAPLLASVHLQHGFYLYKTGHYSASINAFDKGIHLGGNQVLGWFNRGYVYQRVKSWSRALQSYDKVLQLDNECFEAHLNRAIVSIEMNDPEKALRDLTFCHHHISENSCRLKHQCMIDLLCTHCLVKLERFDEAIAKVKVYLESNALSQQSHAATLTSAAMLGKVKNVCSHFALLGSKGRDMTRSGHVSPGPDTEQTLKSCTRLLQTSLKADPTCIALRVNLGIALLLQGRYELALKVFKAVIEFNPSMGTPLFTAMAGYAHVFLYWDDPFKAYLCLTSFMKRTRGNSSPDLSLTWAVTNHALGNLDIARQTYTKLCVPEVPLPLQLELSLLAGALCLRRRDTEGAKANYTRILQEKSDHVGVHINLSVARVLEENFKEGLRILVNIGTRCEKFYLLFNRATLYALLDKDKLCQNECDFALRLYPNDLSFTLLRGFSLVRQNRNREAMQDFDSVLRMDDSFLYKLKI